MADNTIANAIKFLKGEEKSLPATKTEGQVYFAYKNVGTAEKPSYTGAIYIDTPIGGTQNRIKMTANADIAEYAKKANTDSQGNLITGYLRNASLTGNADSQTFTFTAPSGAKFNLKLNGVNDLQAGLVTSGDQTFPGYKTLKLRAKPSSIIGSDNENSDGWYKVATSTMSGYGNTNILYYVKNGYGKKESAGILYFEMRSNNISIDCQSCKWLVRGPGITSDMFRVVINGMVWTLYAYQPVDRWGRISITEISNIDMNGNSPIYNITYYNSTTKETTEPDKTISSSDGGQVYLASKTTSDGNGQNIANTYIKSLSYSNDGKQLIATRGSGDTSLKLSLPIASATKFGIVTTDAQSFGGTKTFTTINSTNLTVTGSSGFNYSGIEIATGNKARPVWFAYDGINGKPVVNTNFTYNPATQTLSVANLSGTAQKASNDDGGQNIRSTYVKYKTIKFSAAADKIYLLEGNGAGSSTNTTIGDSNISTAIIPAATDKAAGVITTGTQTFSGEKKFNNTIFVNDCLASKSITGTNITKLVLLSTPNANIGDASHTTSVYFKALLKWICSNYPNKIECTFLGKVIPNSIANTSIFIYNTSQIDATSGLPQYSSGSYTHLGGNIYTFGTYNYAFYFRESLMSDDHYAGSASPGGAATSANKLNTNAGSAALPVYFSNGIPVACSTNLGVSITGNAASATKLTSNAGSTIQPIYFKDGKPIATTYSLNATVKAGISNRIAFYSGNNEISSASSLKYYTATNSKKANQTILRIWGATYGNDATTTISGAASSLSWNDGGPQIQFSTSEAGSQDGALIFTDHDSAGIGASFHFVSNQSEWSVVSKRFVAKTSIIIGQEAHTSSNQGYNLYVNGTEYINGILTAVGDCKFIAHGNEFNFVPTLKASTSVWLNYRQTGGQPTDGDFIINEYIFGNGANKALASIKDGLFSGAATYVRDSNNRTNNISITYSKAEQASTSWLASWNGYELGRISPANITAGKATKLATARTITLSGAVTGSVSFDGSTNVTLTTSVNHTHSQYYDSNVSRTKNTVLAAPNGADGKAVFRSLVAADIPTLTKSKISDFPTSLKNPNALTITLNGGATEGTNKFTYDGSVAKTINITPSGIGAATFGHTHNYAGSSSAGGSANSAIKLATARKISLKGLSQGSANFDGSGDITIEDTGYGCKKYVTQNTITEPYFRIAYFSTKNTYVDASMIFVIDSGCKGGGYGIVKVAFRSDNCVDKDESSCEVLWLVRQGFEANQLFAKGYAPAGGTQYVDLYFKATGTYQAVTIRVLSSGGRGSQNRNWTFEESAPLAAATIRAYSYIAEGFDAGTANLSHFATKLQTPRIINGTSFNGGADITTAKWGTARNIYIRDCNSTNTGTAVSVNGSDNAYLLMPSTARFTGSVGIGNGSGATLNFYTAANTIGAKIVAYNDRIEFVFA